PSSLLSGLRSGEAEVKALRLSNSGTVPLTYSLTVLPRPATSAAGAAAAAATDCAPLRALVTKRADGTLVGENLKAGPVTTLAAGLGLPSVGLALDGSGKTAYIVDSVSSRILAFDVQTSSLRQVIGGLIDPTGLAVSVYGSRLVVAEQGIGTLATLDLKTGAFNRVAGPLGLVAGVALNPTADIAYIGQTAANALASVDLAHGT